MSATGDGWALESVRSASNGGSVGQEERGMAAATASPVWSLSGRGGVLQGQRNVSQACRACGLERRWRSRRPAQQEVHAACAYFLRFWPATGAVHCPDRRNPCARGPSCAPSVPFCHLAVPPVRRTALPPAPLRGSSTPAAPAAAVPAGSSLLQQPWWITGIAQPVHGNMGSGTRRVGGASGARCQPCRGTRVPAASSTPADRMHHALASFVARKPLQVSLSVPTSFPVAEPGAACCAQRSQLLPDTIASHQVQACPAHRWRCPDGLQQVRLSSQGLATGAIPCARGILPH